jgi:hypothetical protein
VLAENEKFTDPVVHDILEVVKKEHETPQSERSRDESGRDQDTETEEQSESLQEQDVIKAEDSSNGSLSSRTTQTPIDTESTSVPTTATEGKDLTSDKVTTTTVRSILSPEEELEDENVQSVSPEKVTDTTATNTAEEEPSADGAIKSNGGSTASYLHIFTMMKILHFEYH